MSKQARPRAPRPKVEAVAAPAPASHLAFTRSLLAELARRDPDGRRLADATDVEQAAALAASQILDPSLLWMEHLGALYDTDGVRSLLGRDGGPVSRQAVHQRKGLLGLTTGSGRTVYPAFQFRDRTLVLGLDRVLAALPESVVSRWTVASWLVTPQARLDPDRPIDVLAAGNRSAVDRVVQEARDWAARLAV